MLAGGGGRAGVGGEGESADAAQKTHGIMVTAARLDTAQLDTTQHAEEIDVSTDHM